MNLHLRCALLGLLLAGGTALAYPVQVTLETHGLEVKVDHTQVGNGTILNLLNGEPRAVRCDVNFRNGPERRRRRVSVDATASRTVTFTPQRAVTRMRVNVECLPAHEDDDSVIDPDIDQIIDE